MQLNSLSPEDRRTLFERDQRIEAVLFKLATSLADAGHIWSNEERSAFDWAARNLKKDMELLVAA
jgi:hypothetical protein